MYVNPFTEQPVHALVLYIYLYYVLQSTMHLYIRLHGLYVANVQFMWIMLKWTNIIPSHWIGKYLACCKIYADTREQNVEDEEDVLCWATQVNWICIKLIC